MSSEKTAGSVGSLPYTAVVDFMTTLRSDSAFWHAAKSCIVPMTLISFIADRPPTAPGVAITDVWTTVSTSVACRTLTISGLRMSARTNSVRLSST